MSNCWVCGGDSAFSDEWYLDWCEEHLSIWTEAWKATSDEW